MWPASRESQEINRLLRFWSSTFKEKVNRCLIDFSWQLVGREVQHPSTTGIVQLALNFASNVNDPVWPTANSTRPKLKKKKR